MPGNKHKSGKRRPKGQRQRQQRQQKQQQQQRRPQQPATREEQPERLGEAVGERQGVLELNGKGGGYLRAIPRHLIANPNDAYVGAEVIRKHGLRGGEFVIGTAQAVEGRSAYAEKVTELTQIGKTPVSDWMPPAPLESTTAIDPDVRLRFSTPGGPRTMWVVDLFTPIGMGQRGLIVAPPRTGKTVLLQQMAHGIATNHPAVYMLVLLIDERPEEVTEMRRSVRGEVIASSNDQDVESHIRVARLVIERARRLVEAGEHIVILLDSITRLARAFNAFVGSSGRTMTGGLDIRALQEPKQIFGAARNVEGGGSLTIIASALVDTGSRADDFIFQEFKGTGNMELELNRDLANLRIWPAMNLQQSGTRKEEKLLPEEMLQKAHFLRRQLSDMPITKQMTALLERMQRPDSLDAFLAGLKV